MDKKISLEESYKMIKEIEKNTEFPRVFLSVITSSHSMYCLPQFMKALKNINYPNMEVMIVDNSADNEAMNFCRSMRDLGYTVIHLDRVKYTRENLTNSRNYTVDYFLRHNKENPDNQFEYFFSLESDVIPSPDIIQELMKNQKDFVSGVYMNGKVYPPKQEGGSELHTWIPMAWQYPEDGIPELNVLRPMDLLKDVVPSRLQRVQSTGLGCVLIKAHVMEKVHRMNKGKTFHIERDSVACFRKGTNILTEKGYVNIEDVKVGDKVWTHKNRFKEVLVSGKTRDYTGDMITITTVEEKELTVTADHNCFRYNSEEEIVEAKDLIVNDKVKTKEGFTYINKITVNIDMDEPVYNLTIDEDHSIMTDAFVVKNCDDMFLCTDVTKVCSNPDCNYISDKYIHNCPKCNSTCIWCYLDSKTWCRHDHREWNSELRKFR